MLSEKLRNIAQQEASTRAANRAALNTFLTFYDREVQAAASDELITIARSTNGWRSAYIIPGTENTNNQQVILGFEAFSQRMLDYFGPIVNRPQLGRRDFGDLFMDYSGDRVDYLTWLVGFERQLVLGCNVAENIERAPLTTTWALARYDGGSKKIYG